MTPAEENELRETVARSDRRSWIAIYAAALAVLLVTWAIALKWFT